MRRISEEETGVALEQMLAVFGRPEAWNVAAPLYIRALSDLSPEQVHKAVARCVRERQRFMPTPAELRAYVAGDDPAPARSPPPPHDPAKERLLDELEDWLAEHRLGYLDRAAFSHLSLAEIEAVRARWVVELEPWAIP